MKNHSFTTEYLTMEASKTNAYQCFIDMRLFLPPQDLLYLFKSSLLTLMHLHYILFRTTTGVHPMLPNVVANWNSINKVNLFLSNKSNN